MVASPANEKPIRSHRLAGRALPAACPAPAAPSTAIARGSRSRFTLAASVLVQLADARSPAAADDLSDVRREIATRHDEAVQRLRDWIALPSIAAENLNFPAGAEHMAKLAREAGFQQATVLETDGKPGVFATLDAGAAKTVGLYFMYDVKQYDPAEWTSPPLEAQMVDKPGLGQGDRRPRRGQPEGTRGRASSRRCTRFAAPAGRCR